jgi:hypothetical protein
MVHPKGFPSPFTFITGMEEHSSSLVIGAPSYGITITGVWLALEGGV